MSPNVGWRTTFFLIVIAAFGMAKTSAGQDLGPEDLRRLGRHAFDEGRYSEAVRDLRFALEEFGRGGNSLEIARTLGDLASVLVAVERYSEAEQLLDRALAVMPEGVGAHPRETSRFLANLGALYAQTGRHPAAESAFKRAVRLLEQYAPDDAHIVVVLSNLGTLSVQNGNYKQARTHLQKAFDLAEKRLGSDHRDLVPVLTNFAALYQRQKKWAFAEPYLLRAAGIAERSLRPDHPERALILEHLGVVHYRQGKLYQAEMELRRALDIDLNALGMESFRSVSTSLNLAKVLTAQHRYDEARILYSSVLPVQERLLGSKAPELATTLESFAGLLHTMKSREPAKEMEARARRIRAELAYTRSVIDSQRW